MLSPPDVPGTVSVELIAVVVAVTDDEPRVLTIGDGQALPSGPLAGSHRSLQTGLRSWVERQTHHPLGYIEQLYTFADRDRTPDGTEARAISISYVGLTREQRPSGDQDPDWRSWYRYFPWEDRRGRGAVALLDGVERPLRRWIADSDDADIRRDRAERAAIAFGLGPDPGGHGPWNEDLALQRYELLYEAGLVPEATQRRPVAAAGLVPGAAMLHDHRRILATAVARLRAKIKYHPVLFELMPPSFTRLQLQRTVEALAGCPLHKPNFRRLIDQQGLVEETGEVALDTGGRPARLVRFRREVVRARGVAGTRLPLSRSA